jgi:peroxiredoxin
VVHVQNDCPRFQRAGGVLLVVSMGTPEQTAEFRAALGTELTFLADARREAYRAYGLKRGRWWQVLGPGTWLPGIRAFAKAGGGSAVGDVWQMPGAFVIDRRGIVRYAHYPRLQTDHPSHDEIVAVLESLGEVRLGS